MLKESMLYWETLYLQEHILLNLSAPSNLTVTEKTVVINSIARSKLLLLAARRCYSILVNYKVENGNYVSQIVFSSDFELLDT